MLYVDANKNREGLGWRIEVLDYRKGNEGKGEGKGIGKTVEQF